MMLRLSQVFLVALLVALGTGRALAQAPDDPAPAEHALDAHAPHGDAHGHAIGHSDKKANPLEFQTDLAIWTAVVFVVLLLVLSKFAWGPIVAGLEKREQRI